MKNAIDVWNNLKERLSKVEYIALGSVTCELIWLIYILRDLHITCCKPLVLYCDNQSVIHITLNPIFHESTKHLKIDFHLVREKIKQGVTKLLPISPQEKLDNFLTKPLATKKFKSFISKLGMIDIYHA